MLNVNENQVSSKKLFEKKGPSVFNKKALFSTFSSCHVFIVKLDISDLADCDQNNPRQRNEFSNEVKFIDRIL